MEDNKQTIKEEALNAIFNKAAVSEAYKIAQTKDISEEEAYELAGTIAADAQLDTPVTEDGKYVKVLADKAVEDAKNGIPSPFMPTATFDYKKLRDDTTGAALAKAFGILAKYDLIAKEIQTPEESEATFQAYHKCSIELFTLLNENNVRIADFSYFFGMLSAVIKTLESITNEQVSGHRSEIFSRLLGAVNPGTGEADQSYATYKQLLDLEEKTPKVEVIKNEDK